MKTSTLTLVDGTSALAPSAQLEAELLKDRWDARNIPGLRYAPHTGNYYVNFTNVPEVFRPIVKDYAKFLLSAGRVALTLGHCVYYLGKFFTFSLSAIQVFVRFKTWWSKISTHFSLIYAQLPTPVGKRRATAKFGQACIMWKNSFCTSNALRVQ